MGARFTAGDGVQTPFGKGIVRDVRNHGRLLVQVKERTMVIDDGAVSLLPGRQRLAPSMADGAGYDAPRGQPSPSEVDLHGLHVGDALTAIDAALDAALRAGLAELRFIHGRSGGRLRGALHKRLRAIAAVRGVRLDPRNPGVTIVSL